MRIGGLMRCGLMVVALLPLLAMAAPIGVLTIADGEVSVLRETLRFGAAEGLRLEADDIVRTADSTRLARIELDDGTAIDLGPATQALLRPRTPLAADRAPALYLLQGWAKVSTAPQPATPALVWAPRLEAARIGGHAVLHVAADAVWLFAESGSANVLPRAHATGATAQALADGDSFLARGAEPGRSLRRAPADLLARMPRAFADSLPRRAARFAAMQVAPSGAAEAGVAEVAPWLNVEPPLRSALVTRFAPLAQQARFRQGLLAERVLPTEWQRVLFPAPVRARPPAVLVRRVLPPPAAPARPATADAQWRTQVEPVAASAVTVEPPQPAATAATVAASAPDEAPGAAAPEPPPTEPATRGDTP